MISGAQPQNNNKRLLNVKESAQVLGVSTATVWRNIDLIGCYRIGNRVLFSEEEHLLPFLRRFEQKPKVEGEVSND